jgi:hypothetical protein
VLEHRRAEAEVRRDNIALDAMLDNALVMIEDDGTMRSKAEYLSKTRLAGTAAREIVVESMTVRGTEKCLHGADARLKPGCSTRDTGSVRLRRGFCRRRS